MDSILALHWHRSDNSAICCRVSVTTQSRQVDGGHEDMKLAGVGLTAGMSISKLPGQRNAPTISDPVDNRCQSNGGRLTHTPVRRRGSDSHSGRSVVDVRGRLGQICEVDVKSNWLGRGVRATMSTPIMKDERGKRFGA